MEAMMSNVELLVNCDDLSSENDKKKSIIALLLLQMISYYLIMYYACLASTPLEEILK